MKKRDNTKRIVATVLAVLVAFAMLFSIVYPAISANAASTSDLTKQADQAKKNKEEAKKQYDSINNQKKNVQKESQKIDVQITNAEASIDKVKAQLKESEKNIARISVELDAAEQKWKGYDESFKTRARLMYENGTSSYLEVLFGAESFSDFISRVELVKQIIDYDRGIVKQLADIKNEVKKKKDALENEKEAQRLLKAQLEDRVDELETRKQAKDALAKQLESEAETYKKAYQKYEAEEEKARAEIAKATGSSSGPYTGGKLAWPVPGHTKISSPYGYRIHPVLKTKKFHSGIDIPAPYGTSICAAGDGTVIKNAYNAGGFGNYIVIDHGGGITTLYGHNSKNLVSVGTKVKKGDVIAKAGSTGMSTGNHLHFSVLKNGQYTDPTAYLK